ncbi:affde993-6bb3-4f24-97e7-df8c59fe5d0e-CDS [Sclerotinia trifoliorum]|uniref:Affde993-6bb3-4f24-97e7-df8c59fe5d0e-CDS n=1 Tax=Sclerotinia trifoliorum TaxID=28548 RepID=A0A8H2ZUI7_9HELO|nr:affde993-6bb3-4f24-97e7-df8c59fe5d0e-CDS [Sclerotinia trifoliorum]
MHFRHFTSVVALICALPLSFSFVIDRSEIAPDISETSALQPRDKYTGNFRAHLGKSSYCNHKTQIRGNCVVGYLLDINPSTRDKNKTPIEIGTFVPPCDGNTLTLNHPDDKTKYHALDESFDLSTKGTKSSYPKVENLNLRVEAYGELKGPAHAPVIKIGDEELVVTNITDLPDDLEKPKRRGSKIMWAATYPCNNF